MITIATSQIHDTRRSRWSIRHAGARSNARFRSQLMQLMHRSSSPKPHTYAHSKPLTCGNAVDQWARSRWLPARTSPAALKSP
jgi:hypothetical protein